MPTEHAPRRILAISSGGGHWVELLRVRKAFAGNAVTWATVREAYRDDVGDDPFVVIPDATRWNKLRLLHCALKIAWTILRLRPHVIVSTGAAPGYFALRLGKLFGARTVWIDSIANVDELSMSGARVGAYADLWLTQWPHLAQVEGPSYHGAVL